MTSHRFGSIAALSVLFLFVGTFAMAQDTGLLRTRVSPAVAGVFVDGKYYGTVSQFQSASKALVVPVGEHKVDVIDPRYEPISQTVNIQSGEAVVIRQDMTPKALPSPPFGKLKIKNGNRAAVYLNNTYYGQADEFNGVGQALLLKPGEYHLRVVPVTGGSPLEQQVTVVAKQTTTIRMQ